MASHTELLEEITRLIDVDRKAVERLLVFGRKVVCQLPHIRDVLTDIESELEHNAHMAKMRTEHSAKMASVDALLSKSLN